LDVDVGRLIGSFIKSLIIVVIASLVLLISGVAATIYTQPIEAWAWIMKLFVEPFVTRQIPSELAGLSVIFWLAILGLTYYFYNKK